MIRYVQQEQERHVGRGQVPVNGEDDISLCLDSTDMMSGTLDIEDVNVPDD